MVHVGNRRGCTPPLIYRSPHDESNHAIRVCCLPYPSSPGSYTTVRVSARDSAAGDRGFGGAEGHHHLTRWGQTVARESVPGPWRAQPARRAGALAKPRNPALRNITVSPSLTAPGHIAIATGSTAAANDIVANTFHLIASPFTSNISGFAAPIGGYLVDPPAQAPTPTAEPIWVTLRHAGKKVVTATWPGADGLDIRLPPDSDRPLPPVVEPAYH